MEKYITYRVIAATGNQPVERIEETSNNTEEVDTTVQLDPSSPLGVKKIWAGTKAEYIAIAIKDTETIYLTTPL